MGCHATPSEASSYANTARTEVRISICMWSGVRVVYWPTFDSNPIRGHQRQQVGASMPLHHPPPVRVAGQARILGFRPNGCRVKEDLCPHERHCARLLLDDVIANACMRKSGCSLAVSINEVATTYHCACRKRRRHASKEKRTASGNHWSQQMATPTLPTIVSHTLKPVSPGLK